jgi:hypothetical protein
MQQDLRHEKLETLKEKLLKLAQQVAGCPEIRIRALMQVERMQLADEIEKREKRGW